MMKSQIMNKRICLTNKLDDVELGGATVFTHTGVTVWPKKGMAVFWWNLMSDLSGDTLTRHGGCPVLHGSKWSEYLFSFHYKGSLMNHAFCFTV